MAIQEHITELLKSKYNPDAILLHGSRATGHERTHSDWDVVLLFDNQPNTEISREEIAGEDVELKVYTLPLGDKFIENNLWLQHAKVLWESGKSGTELLMRAQTYFSKGPNVTPELAARYKLYMNHKLLGMEDDINNPPMFWRHFETFLDRAVRWYLEIHLNRFSQPYYTAFPLIAEKNPAYHELLTRVADYSATPQERIVVAKEIVTQLFK